MPPKKRTTMKEVLEAVQTVGTTVSGLEDRLTKLEEGVDEQMTGSSRTSDNPESVTLRDLQQVNDLQKKVAKRAKELEDAFYSDESDDEPPSKKQYSRKGKKSGRARTANDKVQKEVDWPHFYVYKGDRRSPAEYDKLELPEFVYGYTCQLLKEEVSVQDKNRRLEHLRDLMLDTAEYGFEGPRNFHSILLGEMEQKRLSWEDDLKIQQLRLQYSQKSPKAVEGVKKKESTREYIEICRNYNRGFCKESRAHKSIMGITRHHICSACYRKGQTKKHKAYSSECPLGKEEEAKI